MKIKSLRIQNFRCFCDETIDFNKYTCFVGPNGAGKSTILSALNIFFREQFSSSTDTSKLTDEDYFNRNINEPVRITITFNNLTPTAQSDLATYFRQSELTVTAEATFDSSLGFGSIHYYGQRLGKEEFRRFFDAVKMGLKADDLQKIYSELREQFPDLSSVKSKDDKISELHSFEIKHPESCVLIPSEDNFYGINGSGKLNPYILWIYVPAVKDVCEEGQEAKNTALGKLIARTVRTKINFDDQIETIKQDTLKKYTELLEQNRKDLGEISESLQKKLINWAHPDAHLQMTWLSDPNKSITVQSPVAGIETGEGGFIGNLARMGNGLQRSYLLALLQELAGSDVPGAPTLILACEEPELYQHPPQIRHLEGVFSDLAKGNNQIILTTHSPLFVNGEGFENTRIVHRLETGSSVHGLSYDSLCSQIRTVTGEDVSKSISGTVAKIHQVLQPGIAEMFFTRVPILVEGLEDVAYIITQMHISNLWLDYRRLGCHLVPVNGKDKLIKPLAILKELNLSSYIVFDADGDDQNIVHRNKHEKDNKALIALLGSSHDPFPEKIVQGKNYTIWPTSLTKIVKDDFNSNYERLKENSRLNYLHEGDLEKNSLFIADWLSCAASEGLQSSNLQNLCQSIIDYAKNIK